MLIEDQLQRARLPMCTSRHSSKALPGRARQLELSQELQGCMQTGGGMSSALQFLGRQH